MRLIHSPTFLASFALIIGLAAIIGAWAFQLIGGYQPCALCLAQRVPYYIGLPTLALGLILLWSGLQRFKILAVLLFAGFIAAMIYGLSLAVYHAGAEWGFWMGPSDCGNTGTPVANNAQDLIAQMQGIRLVSCTDAALRIFGLSFAGWNALVSLALIGLGGMAMRATIRNRKRRS